MRNTSIESKAWCNWRGARVDARQGRDASACHDRQADAGIIADRRGGFPRHIACALLGPIVVLLPKRMAPTRRVIGRAWVAIARKLAVVLHRIWSEETAFRFAKEPSAAASPARSSRRRS